MSGYIKHCFSKGNHDNEVALACSVNALFLSIMKVLKMWFTTGCIKIKGKGVRKTKTVFYRTYEPGCVS